MRRLMSLAILLSLALAPLAAQSTAGWKVRADRSTSATDPDAAGEALGDGAAEIGRAGPGDDEPPLLGAMVVGRPADAFGRRRVLFAIAVLYFVSAVGTALAWDWWSLLFFRFRKRKA